MLACVTADRRPSSLRGPTLDISLGGSRILALDPRLDGDGARRRAEEKKPGALGSGTGGLLPPSRPEDVVLAAEQHQTVVVPPDHHVSAVVRHLPAKLIVPLLAGETKTATPLRIPINRRIWRDAMLDIGADTIGMVVRGSNIAPKVARAALDRTD